MALFLLIILVAVALGLIGVIAKGVLYLLFIGILIFLLDIAIAGWLRTRRRVTR